MNVLVMAVRLKERLDVKPELVGNCNFHDIGKSGPEKALPEWALLTRYILTVN